MYVITWLPLKKAIGEKRLGAITKQPCSLADMLACSTVEYQSCTCMLRGWLCNNSRCWQRLALQGRGVCACYKHTRLRSRPVIIAAPLSQPARFKIWTCGYRVTASLENQFPGKFGEDISEPKTPKIEHELRILIGRTSSTKDSKV